jgi:hypothetical protein
LRVWQPALCRVDREQRAPLFAAAMRELLERSYLAKKGSNFIRGRAMRIAPRQGSNLRPSA